MAGGTPGMVGYKDPNPPQPSKKAIERLEAEGSPIGRYERELVERSQREQKEKIQAEKQATIEKQVKEQTAKNKRRQEAKIAEDIITLQAAQQLSKPSPKFEALRSRRIAELKEQIKEPQEVEVTKKYGDVEVTLKGTTKPFQSYKRSPYVPPKPPPGEYRPDPIANPIRQAGQKYHVPRQIQDIAIAQKRFNIFLYENVKGGLKELIEPRRKEISEFDIKRYGAELAEERKKRKAGIPGFFQEFTTAGLKGGEQLPTIRKDIMIAGAGAGAYYAVPAVTSVLFSTPVLAATLEVTRFTTAGEYPTATSILRSTTQAATINIASVTGVKLIKGGKAALKTSYQDLRGKPLTAQKGQFSATERAITTELRARSAATEKRFTYPDIAETDISIIRQPGKNIVYTRIKSYSPTPLSIPPKGRGPITEIQTRLRQEPTVRTLPPEKPLTPPKAKQKLPSELYKTIVEIGGKYDNLVIRNVEGYGFNPQYEKFPLTVARIKYDITAPRSKGLAMPESAEGFADLFKVSKQTTLTSKFPSGSIPKAKPAKPVVKEKIFTITEPLSASVQSFKSYLSTFENFGKYEFNIPEFEIMSKPKFRDLIVPKFGQDEDLIVLPKFYTQPRGITDSRVLIELRGRERDKIKELGIPIPEQLELTIPRERIIGIPRQGEPEIQKEIIIPKVDIPPDEIIIPKPEDIPEPEEIAKEEPRFYNYPPVNGGAKPYTDITPMYQTYAKEKGRYIKVSRKPLPFNKALNLGADVVDNTASATFLIKKAGSSKKKVIDDPFFTHSNKFRFKKNTYIEKNFFRIDSPGEIQGITVKGWLANRSKAMRFI